MKKYLRKNGFIVTLLFACSVSVIFMACNQDEEEGDIDMEEGVGEVTELHAAFAEFDEDETDIYIEGTNFVIETTGNPNHNTVYWGEGHPKFIEATVATALTPSRIPGYDAATTLRVSASPQFASSSTATTLGAIGIAISGAAIFNDQEGMGDLNDAAVSLDYTGGHIGPSEYHYHLEPTAWTQDDENLVGILADGFFIYGRKCDATGTYPTDLDESGGHTSTTQHATEAEYHYHIENELYLNKYYVIFPGDYQGTKGSFN